MSLLVELYENFGQSPWLDSIDREWITSGKLQDLVAHHGLRGLTSNPAIFEKAMTRSEIYDEQIKSLLASGEWEVKALYEELAIADIQAAADLLRPVYERSAGQDGFASLEVTPWFARDTLRTIEEARRLWKKLDRPNVMIKVPGTDEGIPAIRALIAEGINVNVTLLFSRALYRRVAEAYREGLEERAAAGKPVHSIASVASFFVSRIDSAADKKLGELKDPRASELRGKVAIANAKLAYELYQEMNEEDRWKKLASRGAHPQRLLWASTSTKNPDYSDVYYVDALIGRDTVNTMPPATLKAFENHGTLHESLTEDLGGAGRVLSQLSELGISLDEITDRLTEDAIRLFAEPFDSLMANLERRKRRESAPKINPISLRLPMREMIGVGETLKAWKTMGKIRQLWSRDSSLWTGHDESKWLGWLGAVDAGLAQVEEWEEFRSKAVALDFNDIVLLGMGGSSLAPEVFRITFDRAPEAPEFHVLDSTDPEQIARLERRMDPTQTLFIVSSKSGTTLEPTLFFEYFYDKLKKDLGESQAGKHFIAITDPDSPLERLARERGFLKIFHGNPEIGGRYSALSAFGLIPAVLMGMDVKSFLERTREMVHSCSENVPPDENPGVILGAALGALGHSGRDKITMICAPKVGELAVWLEQLLAESTGKRGKGLIPISEEEVGSPESYWEDRVFIYIGISGEPAAELNQKVEALEKFGHPVIRIEMDGAYTLGQEFFRWEMAAAVAGSILGINPFDQPDVEVSKVETRNLTSVIERTGKLPEEMPLFTDEGIHLFADETNARELRSGLPGGSPSLAGFLKAHFDRVREHDYVAILAYLDMNIPYKVALQETREIIRSSKRVATCLGFGPRFLHSAGQLYKGGPDSGVFLQITTDHARDLPIPGHAYTFGQVEAAQAKGDFDVLVGRRRRCLRVHLPEDRAFSLQRLREAVWLALSGRLKSGVAA